MANDFFGQRLSSTHLSLKVPFDRANMQSKSVGELVNQVGEVIYEDR